MTTATTDIQVSGPRRGFFARIIDAYLHSIESRSRYAERCRRVEALEAKTDAELAEMGLRREGILMHVFGDLYYV